jgi:hypothetical protein
MKRTKPEIQQDRAQLALTVAKYRTDQPGALDAAITYLQGWVDTRLGPLSGDYAPLIEEVIPALMEGLHEAQGGVEQAAVAPAEATTEQRLAKSAIDGVRARYLDALRGCGAPHPLLAFYVEVRLYQGGFTRPSDPHLRTAIGNVAALVRDHLEAETVSVANSRTEKRKPPVRLAGLYLDDAGNIQRDHKNPDREPLELEVSRRSADLLMAHFQRSQGTARGAQTYAMKQLKIKDSRTLHDLE